MKMGNGTAHSKALFNYKKTEKFDFFGEKE